MCTHASLTPRSEFITESRAIMIMHWTEQLHLVANDLGLKSLKAGSANIRQCAKYLYNTTADSQPHRSVAHLHYTLFVYVLKQGMIYC